MRKLLLSILIMVLATALATNWAPANAQGLTYVVQPGDTLFSIAAQFNVGVSDLATVNGIYDVNAIYIGQTLTIPGSIGQPPIVYPPYTTPPVVNPPVYVPRPVYHPPYYYTPSYVNPYPTSVTIVTTYMSYVVRPGDFLSTIASRYGTSIQAIMDANGIANPDLIYTGMLLVIPKSSTTVVPPVFRPRPVIYGRTYIVQYGDTMFGIAARFGRDVYAIARANGILNLNAIYAGLPLIIP